LLQQFPKNFYWGTATSAYQVEGGIRNDWSLAGEKYNAGIACDHYHRYEEDFDLARKMNNNAHRFSIEWARIEPVEGKFNQAEIEHYRQVIVALKKRNLEPFVTLWHFTLPDWFAKKGGWLDLGAPQYFQRYAERMVNEFKDLVKFWITMNEPDIYLAHSYLRGYWPPFSKSFFRTQQILGTLVNTHKNIHRAVHKISPDSFVGITKFNTQFKGVLNFFSDYYWNHQILQAIKDHKRFFDFIGLDYYISHSLFEILKITKREKTDMGWEIRPEGIYNVLKDLERYKKPIYITENGLADAKDTKRAKFIIDHLKWIRKAIEEGIDVRGYFHWSLIDNFEWDKGFEPRFGLVEVDYKNNLKRIPRPSSKVYAEICKNSAINI